MISTLRQKCVGITREGNPCRNTAKEGSEYCHFHELPPNEQNDVVEFVKKRGVAVLAFLAGSSGQAIVADLYGDLKTKLVESASKSWGTWSGEITEVSDDRGWNWIAKSYWLERVAQLQFGMNYNSVVKIMGFAPNVYEDKDLIEQYFSFSPIRLNRGDSFYYIFAFNRLGNSCNPGAPGCNFMKIGLTFDSFSNHLISIQILLEPPERWFSDASLEK